MRRSTTSAIRKPYPKYCAPEGYEKSDECVEVAIGGDKMHRLVEFVNTRKCGTIRVVKYGI